MTMPAAATHRSRKRARRSQRETPPLPLDVVLEIAARSDPVTLVRCAATCKEARRHVVDPAFHRSLRLRHADGFVPSLLHGHLVWKSATDLYLINNTTLHASKLLTTVGWWYRPDPSHINKPLLWHKVLTARDGLLLISTRYHKGTELMLRVCNPATGRCQVVPRQRYEGQYVLLVGDGDVGGAVGRSFRVLKVTTKSAKDSDRRILQFQTFFSEHGRWAGRCVHVPIPFVHGGWFRQQPLVSNGSLHWLCRSDKLYYIVKLHVDSAQVTTMELPVSFHREYGSLAAARKQLLLGTTSAKSNRLCVFAAEKEKICVWEQSKSDSSRWTKRPRMEIEFGPTKLEWFSDRSGVILMEAPGHDLYMLDVRSKKVFGSPPSLRSSYSWDPNVCCPYEMDVSSWVPSFRNKTF